MMAFFFFFFWLVDSERALKQHLAGASVLAPTPRSARRREDCRVLPCFPLFPTLSLTPSLPQAKLFLFFFNSFPPQMHHLRSCSRTRGAVEATRPPKGLPMARPYTEQGSWRSPLEFLEKSARTPTFPHPAAGLLEGGEERRRRWAGGRGGGGGRRRRRRRPRAWREGGRAGGRGGAAVGGRGAAAAGEGARRPAAHSRPAAAAAAARRSAALGPPAGRGPVSGGRPLPGDEGEPRGGRRRRRRCCGGAGGRAAGARCALAGEGRSGGGTATYPGEAGSHVSRVGRAGVPEAAAGIAGEEPPAEAAGGGRARGSGRPRGTAGRGAVASQPGGEVPGGEHPPPAEAAGERGAGRGGHTHTHSSPVTRGGARKGLGRAAVPPEGETRPRRCHRRRSVPADRARRC